MSEVWRPIFGGRYEVSSFGMVRRAVAGRRTAAGKTLTMTLLKIGYFKVSPVMNGKNVFSYVHALVAEAFLGPRPDGHEVNHRDGNKKNNRVENLEYVTHAGNMAHARATGLSPVGARCGKSHLTDALVVEMRADWKAGMCGRDVSQKYGVSRGTVSEIVNRKKWRHVS